MPDHKDKDELLKAPPKAGERTTAYGTPTPSAETTELATTDLTLAALRERYDILAEVGRSATPRVSHSLKG